MVDIVLTAEQIRSAPREVKDWIRAVLDHDFAFEHRPLSRNGESSATMLAACSEQEAAALLERIRPDYVVSQVFFELGRDELSGSRRGEYHRVGLADIMRHVRLNDPQHLAGCLEEIDGVFRDLRGDPEAELFAFDESGNCFIREETHLNVRKLFQALLAARLRDVPAPPHGMAIPAGPSMPISARPVGWPGGDGATAGRQGSEL